MMAMWRGAPAVKQPWASGGDTNNPVDRQRAQRSPLRSLAVRDLSHRPANRRTKTFCHGFPSPFRPPNHPLTARRRRVKSKGHETLVYDMPEVAIPPHPHCQYTTETSGNKWFENCVNDMNAHPPPPPKKKRHGGRPELCGRHDKRCRIYRCSHCAKYIV
ncbi:hypothetical protein BaRGS_00034301 [Batillaria attramentaria]|uniref:Uncharacterized protein n=1 Tax=Batillaria attramentaria TaxID=370345 RepID=A0ABD0JI22_9CAEN